MMGEKRTKIDTDRTVVDLFSHDECVVVFGIGRMGVEGMAGRCENGTSRKKFKKRCAGWISCRSVMATLRASQS